MEILVLVRECNIDPNHNSANKKLWEELMPPVIVQTLQSIE